MYQHDALNTTVCPETGPAAQADWQTWLFFGNKTLIWRRRVSPAVLVDAASQQVVLNGTKRRGVWVAATSGRNERTTGMSSWHDRNVTGAAREGGVRESQAGRDVNRAAHWISNQQEPTLKLLDFLSNWRRTVGRCLMTPKASQLSAFKSSPQTRNKQVQLLYHCFFIVFL